MAKFLFGGPFQLQDGNQKAGALLESDANGQCSWGTQVLWGEYEQTADITVASGSHTFVDVPITGVVEGDPVAFTMPNQAGFEMLNFNAVSQTDNVRIFLVNHTGGSLSITADSYNPEYWRVAAWKRKGGWS